MGRLLTGAPLPSAVGVAVSGGGDSMALMHLAAQWGRTQGVSIRVITVDHGLREGSADEAALVSRAAVGLGLPHQTACWTGWDGTGNLQDAARQARQRLINDWRGDIDVVLTGHTQDDQAETVLMRLARGSGVDGLAGIRSSHHLTAFGYTLMRPLLEVRRDDLRGYLRDNDLPWAEDPSNSDPRFDRVRMRQALDVLGPLGITVEGLSKTADQMRRGQQALVARAESEVQRLYTPDPLCGDILLDAPGLAQLDRETVLRIVSTALMWVASSPYRPRLDALERSIDAALAGRAATLHGCLMRVHRGQLRISREYKAVADLRTRADGPGLWDGRWTIRAPGFDVRALGEAGVSLIDLPPDAPPRGSLRPLPSIWQDDRLMGCKALNFGVSYEQYLTPAGGTFAQAILSH